MSRPSANLFWLLVLSILGIAATAPGAENVPDGYPKPVMFRANTPGNLAESGDWIQMVVSDHHVWTRQYSAETYKERFPERPAIIHVGGDFISANGYSPKQMVQDRGLYEGEVAEAYVKCRKGYEEILNEDFLPMPEFLGYWVYEAGLDTTQPIAASQEVTVHVPETNRFEARKATPPPMAKQIEGLTGSPLLPRIVALCPRDRTGNLDWTRAELADVIGTDEKAGTIRVRRFDTGEGFPEIASGAYVAASMSCWDRVVEWGFQNLSESHPFHYPVWQFFAPNFTAYCPVDPETGLNGAQWFARQFIGRKNKYYPKSNGFALDVTISTFLPDMKFVENADFNNDGVKDHGFLDGRNWWGLGMHDFVYYMRAGVPGLFKGLGDEILLTWDTTDNGEQRLFHLLNGGEYEHAMIVGVGWGPMQHEYSSNLDRLLLWSERAREPRLTFVSNKNPNEAFHGGTAEDLRKVQENRPYYSLHYWRLDLASACMGTGYANQAPGRGHPPVLNDYPGKAEQGRQYGTPLPTDYDEYHQGEDNIRGWLGKPLAPPQRYAVHLGPILYACDPETAPPEIESKDPAWKASARRFGKTGLRFEVRETGAFADPVQAFTLTAQLSLGSAQFEEMAEYTIRFKARGSSPYGDLDERYRPLPRNIELRLNVNGKIVPSSAPDYYKNQGYPQECLLFEDEREIQLTLLAPAAGPGVLEICLSESTGTIEMRDLEIRKGCADVLWRPFERGLVVLNGSQSESVSVSVPRLMPEARFSRLKGSQAPKHNDGRPVEDDLVISPRDAFFLKKVN
ncbi:hypothetical protein HQ520_07220 [bacterium]|nr:hypothetical protein [bacterium]